MKIANINVSKPASYPGTESKIKEINGVNGAASSLMPGYPDLQGVWNEMGITHVRFNDLFGPGDIENYATHTHTNGQLTVGAPPPAKLDGEALGLDITNDRAIFPFANEGMRRHDLTLAASEPNWAPTDHYLRETLGNVEAINPEKIERKVMFRVGHSNNSNPQLPADFDIYAELVGQAVQRYSADISLAKLPRKVSYWEIWNESNLHLSDENDFRKFFSFYEKIARKIKAIDPSAKVGGPAEYYMLPATSKFSEEFLNYCQTNKVPLDFYSWQYYTEDFVDPRGFAVLASAIQESLEQHGFASAENICSAWNLQHGNRAGLLEIASQNQSTRNASYITASLISMDAAPVDKAYFNRGDGGFNGLFNADVNPTDRHVKSYCTYAAQAFGLYKQMFDTPELLETSEEDDSGNDSDIHVIAGRGANSVNILLSNFHRDSRVVTTFDPDVTPYAPQYFVGMFSNIDDIKDDWSINEWFGGSKPDPKRRKPPCSPVTVEKASLASDPTIDSPAFNPYRITESLKIKVDDLPSADLKLEVRRIVQGGDLEYLLPAVNNVDVTMEKDGTSVTISDRRAVPYTVALYTISW